MEESLGGSPRDTELLVDGGQVPVGRRRCETLCTCQANATMVTGDSIWRPHPRRNDNPPELARSARLGPRLPRNVVTKQTRRPQPLIFPRPKRTQK